MFYNKNMEDVKRSLMLFLSERVKKIKQCPTKYEKRSLNQGFSAEYIATWQFVRETKACPTTLMAKLSPEFKEKRNRKRKMKRELIGKN